jgi:hypothetical protein
MIKKVGKRAAATTAGAAPAGEEIRRMNHDSERIAQ